MRSGRGLWRLERDGDACILSILGFWHSGGVLKVGGGIVDIMIGGQGTRMYSAAHANSDDVL